MFGNIFLTLGLVASLFTVIMYYFTYKGYENTLSLARIGYHVMATSVIVASLLLLYAILTHQYEYKYVFSYSSGGMSTGLLMSTFWAGQEGSFLLWLLFTSVIGIILLDYTSRRENLEPRVMMVYTLTSVFLLVMVNPLLKNPFSYVWAEDNFINLKLINQAFLSMPALTSFIFQDPQSGESFVKMGPDLVAALKASGIAVGDFIVQGKGLNPLLQNFWMQIHPPMLFIGFAMSGVPFAFAIAALFKNNYENWVKHSLPWLLAGMMTLGLAIMLGGYWAYGVLGWGGYWGWDPVENSSLVPWLIGVAAIHTMLVQKKTGGSHHPGRFVKTNLVLAVLTYVLVMYSTFLTRSGLLSDASVHSFVAPGRVVFLLLLGFILGFTFLGLGMIAYRWKYLSKNFSFEENMLSRELALFTGAVALIASAIIIIAGTSAPIFGSAVEISFYNELNLPIAIIIGLVNGLSLLLKWKQTESGELLKKLRFSVAASAVSTLAVILIAGMSNVVMMLFAFSAFFALFVNLEIAWKVIRGSRLKLGAYVAHAGIALFLLGVIATGTFSQEKQIELVKGEKADVLGHELTFTGYTPTEDGKYEFNIEVNKGNRKNQVSPVMYISSFNNSLMREPDILNMATRDFYVEPVSYNEGKSSSAGEQVTLNKGGNHSFKGRNITFASFDFPEDAMNAMMGGGEFRIGATLSIEYNGNVYEAKPYMKSKGGERSFVGAHVHDAGVNIELLALDASGQIQVALSLDDHTGNVQEASVQKETLLVQASIKPFINLVWAGVIVMVAGFIFSIVRRGKESKA